jgi:hypothetical protein
MATDRTVYLIRTADNRPAYLQWLDCGRYGWTAARKDARPHAGRERALAALAELGAAIAANGCYVPKLEAVPATGGVAIGG